MTETVPKVIVIPPNPEPSRAKAAQHQLRVAAYCRVCTDDEQFTIYEAQRAYYTDKIMTNPQWTMAGIFADVGITGTCAKEHPEFQKMIHKCRQKEIDLILVKSISRFARSTVDCLDIVEELRELGIAVIFEKENLNTMDATFDGLISLMSAFALAECEIIPQNSIHTRRYMRAVSIPKKKTWKKTIHFPGCPDKTIYFRME